MLTYIFGLPGDTPRTVSAAMDFTRQVRPTLADFHPLGYISGAELARDHPDGDAKPFGFRTHQRWASRARLRFYLNPRILWQLVTFVATRNPRYLWDLVRMAGDAFVSYVLDTSSPELAGARPAAT